MRLRRHRQCIPSCSSLHRVDEDEIYWRQKRDNEELEWSHYAISQLAQCFTNAMVGPRSWIGGLFNRSTNRRSDKYVDYPFNPLQVQRLQRLQERLQVPFDETRPDHQESLRSLWYAAFPNVVLTALISEQWKDMGWQGHNPSTDFRGCGFVSLENLLYFARTYPVVVQGRWETSNLGVSIRCCRHKCYFYVNSDARFILSQTKMSSGSQFCQIVRRR